MFIHFPNASKTFFWLEGKNDKNNMKSMLKPARVDDSFGSPNVVRPSQISE